MCMRQVNTTDESNVPIEDVMTHSRPCKQFSTVTRQTSVKTTLSFGKYRGGHRNTVYKSLNCIVWSVYSIVYTF